MSAARSEDKKAAVPGKAAQAKVKTLLAELYGKDYARAEKDAAARAQLAVTLLQEARETRDDLAARYLLFAEAAHLAAAAGDAGIALAAIDDLAHDFAVVPAEALRMKIHALTAASKAVAGADAYHNVIDSALILILEAAGADDYESALRLIETADAAARKLKNVPLVAGIRKRRDEILQAQKVYARWKPFADILAENPDDPKARLEMGRYLAFLKGNWKAGLGLLSGGSDKELRSLARLDLSAPKEAPRQADLGDKWLEQVKRVEEPMAIQVLLRAYYWYVQALAGLDGEARERVEKQMEAVNRRLPADYRIGEITSEVRKIEGHGGPVYTAALTPDGKKAVSGGADNLVHIWDTYSGKEIRRLDGHSGRVWTVAVSPDGRRAASGGFDGSIRLWDLAAHRELRRLSGHADYVRSVAFSPDGRYLLSGGDDRFLRLWNADTGLEVRSMPGHNHFVWSVAVSRDGKRGLSGSLDKTVRLWDLGSGKELLKMTGHADTVLSVAFSPDGRHALSGSTDKTLKLWDLETGQPIRTFHGHKGYVHSAVFSPDGRRALSAGQDRVLILWDVHTGKELRRLEGHTDMAWSVAFSRTGRLAVSAGQDGTIRIWGGRTSVVQGP
jgi:hypothetical protein